MKSFLKIGFLATSIIMLTACGTTGPREHIAPDPKAAELNMQLGLSYLQRGDYEIAMEKLDKALKQNHSINLYAMLVRPNRGVA